MILSELHDFYKKKLEKTREPKNTKISANVFRRNTNFNYGDGAKNSQ